MTVLKFPLLKASYLLVEQSDVYDVIKQKITDIPVHKLDF